MNKRLKSVLCLMLVAAMLLTACAGGNTNSSNGNSAEKDTLNYAISGEPSTFDPHNISDNIAKQVFNQIFDRLIRQEADGTLTPGLAENWELSEDGKSITFKIRKDVKFHNGETMTADDVVFSLNRAIQSKYLQEYVSMMEEAEKIDDETVTLTTKYAYGPIEYCVAKIDIVNKAAVEADPEGFGRQPIGTGAYKFIELKSGDKIIAERFDDYYRGKAPIKNLVFKIITDSSTAVVALENGEVDLLSQPALADRQNLINNDKVLYYETELNGNNYIAFNNTEGMFNNQKLREAISYAIDKESMLLGAIEGAGVAVDNAIPRVSFGYSDKVKGNPYDPEKAKQLLAEAGYPDGFSIKLKTMDSATYYKPTEVLQDQLAQIGITAEIEKMERGAYLSDVYSNAIYDMTVMSMVYEITDADAIYAFFHSDMIENGQNFFRVNNPELDKLLDAGRSSTDEAKRKEIYEKVGQLLNDEVVLIPLYSYMVGVAVNKDLKGVQASSIQYYEVFSFSW
ncbi:MAG: ABC transporter substrate-binding protein [Tissierellia bacterium]|nr:ABC transporter substrate-binding protein [Tissierellia bacterium]MDD4780097.1 ABC transporter substrate-binding protein [Tissierellia bacterium]